LVGLAAAAARRRQCGREDGVGRREDAGPGDILLFARPNQTRDYLIKWVTGSCYYHAALAVGDGTVIEARPRGVIHNDLRGREGEYAVIPAPGGRGREALAWAEAHLGDGFDDEDMLVIALEHVFRHWKINYTRPGRFSCAELVAAAYRDAGVDLVPAKRPSEIAPGDFAPLLPARRQDDTSGTPTFHHALA
jgi:uncharacterized protein YycO